jgi:hypothetical protein
MRSNSLPSVSANVARLDVASCHRPRARSPRHEIDVADRDRMPLVATKVGVNLGAAVVMLHLHTSCPEPALAPLCQCDQYGEDVDPHLGQLVLEPGSLPRLLVRTALQQPGAYKLLKPGCRSGFADTHSLREPIESRSSVERLPEQQESDSIADHLHGVRDRAVLRLP